MKVLCHHRLTFSKTGADESFTRYQKGNGLWVLLRDECNHGAVRPHVIVRREVRIHARFRPKHWITARHRIAGQLYLCSGGSLLRRGIIRADDLCTAGQHLIAPSGVVGSRLFRMESALARIK